MVDSTHLQILEYFPRSMSSQKSSNYWPNMMFHTVIQDGVTLGDACAAFGPARALALAGTDSPDPAFRDALIDGVLSHATFLETSADDDERLGRTMSAGEKRLRAAVLCEHLGWVHDFFWPYSSDDPAEPGKFFFRGRRNFSSALARAGGHHAQVQQIKIPYGDFELDGLFVPARGGSRPAPVVIHLNGMHSSMQWHYTMRLPEFLADRGISSLLYDCPGTGSALHGLKLGTRFDDEVHTNAVIDYLERREDVNADQIGVLGGSWGGYRAARVTAMCDRIRAGVSWPMVWDWGWMTQGPSPSERQIASYRYWTQLETIEELKSFDTRATLAGIAEEIRVPFLIVHGGDEKQVPVDNAERFIAKAVHSPKVELVVLNGLREGGEHCQWDNPNNALTLMADWLAENLGQQD